MLTRHRRSRANGRDGIDVSLKRKGYPVQGSSEWIHCNRLG